MRFVWHSVVMLSFVPLTLYCHAHSLSGFSREKKKRSADKTETRKQYAVLVERASSLWRAVEACRKKGSSGSNLNLNGDGGKVTSACASTSVSDRPRQSDILTIVHEIATLPNVDLPLGGLVF